MTMECKKILALPLGDLTPLQQPGTLRGYASTRHMDKVKDIILPGAFTQTLAHWQREKKGFPNIYEEHDPHHFIGTCKILREDKGGLYLEGKLFIEDIPRAQKVYEDLIKGQKGGLSIGFYVRQSHLQGGVRHIQSLDLVEISIVAHPCNGEAKIHEVKGVHDPTAPKDPQDSTAKGTEILDRERLRSLIALLNTR